MYVCIYIYMHTDYIYIYIYVRVCVCVCVCVCVNNIVIFERGWGNSLQRTFFEGGRGSHIK